MTTPSIRHRILPKMLSTVMVVAILAILVASHFIANAELATWPYNVEVPEYANNFEVIQHHYQLGGGCSVEGKFYGLGMFCTTGLNDSTFHADYLFSEQYTLLCFSEGIPVERLRNPNS